jgi:hypothetical protein
MLQHHSTLREVYAEVRTVEQLYYTRWKKHINKDMVGSSYIQYLRQVYSDMPTGTPEKEYITNLQWGGTKRPKAKYFDSRLVFPH